MRKVLLGEDEPSYLDGAGRRLLDSARRIASKTGAANEGLVVRQGFIQWFPWVGTLG